jgi:hypothetical protein
MSHQSKLDATFAQTPTTTPDGFLTVETDGSHTTVEHDVVASGAGTESGFDLTDFGSVITFSNVLRAHDLEPGSTEEAHFDVVDKAPNRPDRKRALFAWSNPSVALFTGNNPLTGVYSNPDMRSPEEGYASYVGISGREDAVQALYDDVRDRADHVKHADPNGRQYI